MDGIKQELLKMKCGTTDRAVVYINNLEQICMRLAQVAGFQQGADFKPFVALDEIAAKLKEREEMAAVLNYLKESPRSAGYFISLWMEQDWTALAAEFPDFVRPS